MGFPKSFFDEDIEELARFSRGLSLPVRISIIKILAQNGSWVTNEDFSGLQLTIVTRDRHLRSLMHLGLVEDIHTSGLVYYRINKLVFNKMINGYNQIFNLFNENSSNKNR